MFLSVIVIIVVCVLQSDDNYVSLLQLAQDSLSSLSYHECLDVVDACVTLASFVYVSTHVTVTLACVVTKSLCQVCHVL